MRRRMMRPFCLSLCLLLAAPALAPADEPAPQAKLLATLQGGHRGAPRYVVYSPDGKILANGRAGKNELWDLTGGTASATLKPSISTNTVSLTFSPDGKTLITNSRNGLELWDVATGKASASFELLKLNFQSEAPT